MKPTITITPSEYKGWSLRYNESHDRQSDWQATKGAEFVAADKPEALVWKIDERDKVTVRFDPPIKARLFKPYAHKWSDVKIHTLVDGRVYWTDEEGEHVCLLSDLRPGNRNNNDFIADTPANRKTQKKQEALRAKSAGLARQVAAFDKQLQRITDADLLVAAKAKDVNQAGEK